MAQPLLFLLLYLLVLLCVSVICGSLPSLSCVPAKLQTKTVGWQPLALLTLRGRQECNIHSLLQPKRRNRRSGVHPCAVNVLWVDACAQCLGESFKRAWMSSAWQDLTPERNTCLHVCALHDCISLCTKMGADGYKHVHQGISFTLDRGISHARWYAKGPRVQNCWTTRSFVEADLIPSQLTIKECMWDRPLTHVIKPSTSPQNWFTSLVFSSEPQPAVCLH